MLVSEDRLDCLWKISSEIGLKSSHMTTKCGEIYDGMLVLAKDGKYIDIVSLADELKNRDKYSQSISDIDLVHIMNKYSSFNSSYIWMAQRLIHLYLYRKMIAVCDHIKKSCLRLPETPSSLIYEAIQYFQTIQKESATTQSSIKSSDSLEEFLSKYDKLLAGESQPGFSTGFIGLDKQIIGLCPPDLIVLAARPGMGKTSLAMNFMLNIGRLGKKVLIFSLEMSRQQLLQRIIASVGRVDAHLVKRGLIPAPRMAEIIQSIRPILDHIHIDDSSYISVHDIRSVSDREKPDIVMVDYLQLLKGNDELQNRNMQVSEISGNLKQLAKDLDIPVLCLSQLNRDPDNRKNKRPLISDLRDSGSIEQDADLVLFIYRESYYSRKDEGISAAEIIIAKNRHGNIGTVHLGFDSKSTLFISPSNINNNINNY